MFPGKIMFSSGKCATICRELIMFQTMLRLDPITQFKITDAIEVPATAVCSAKPIALRA
jgi:hypothetical protein